ncbi:hypothetical protein D3C85_1207470 [compost metagenome]
MFWTFLRHIRFRAPIHRLYIVVLKPSYAPSWLVQFEGSILMRSDAWDSITSHEIAVQSNITVEDNCSLQGFVVSKHLFDFRPANLRANNGHKVKAEFTVKLPDLISLFIGQIGNAERRAEDLSRGYLRSGVEAVLQYEVILIVQ